MRKQLHSDQEATSEASNHPKGESVLHRFEQEVTASAADYHEYFEAKRQNFFATVQKFPDLWKWFLALDAVWRDELKALSILREPHESLVVVFFLSAHAEFRVALELGFSCCLREAWNVLRSAIESSVHGFKIVRQPELAEVWLRKGDSKEARKRFDKFFTHDKEVELFPKGLGLTKLHEYWSHFSEWGHTTTEGMAARVTMGVNEEPFVYAHYFQIEPKVLAMSLSQMLLAAVQIEKVLFRSFKRFQLDIRLEPRRNEVDAIGKRTCQEVIAQFNIQPPRFWNLTR